jgi:hypothetical protein
MAKKIIAVCGLRNKFRDGPNIIRNNPMIEEMKNLGKRKTFSQKVGIYLIFLYFHRIYHLILSYYFLYLIFDFINRNIFRFFIFSERIYLL